MQSLKTGADTQGELAGVVDDLLHQLNHKFTSISSELLSKSTGILISPDQVQTDICSG
jgi:heat shock factor-binding protein 1